MHGVPLPSLFVPAAVRRAAPYALVDALLSGRHSQRSIARLTGVARRPIAKCKRSDSSFAAPAATALGPSPAQAVAVVAGALPPTLLVFYRPVESLRQGPAAPAAPAPKARGRPASSRPLIVSSANAAACSCAGPTRSASRWPCTRPELKIVVNNYNLTLHINHRQILKYFVMKS